MRHYLALKSAGVALLVLCNTAAFAQPRSERDGRGEEKHGKKKPHYEERRPSRGDRDKDYRDDRYYPSRPTGYPTYDIRPRPPHGHQHVKYYYPKWHPHKKFARRWVYFPRYDMYWDNYRNVYVYYHRGRWITQARAPRVIVNVNLSSERFYEIDDFDDREDVYVNNRRHRITFEF